MGETWAVPGAFINLQSVVVLTVCWRLLFFFRGNLRLGALTYTFGRILIDILALMTFLLVFIVGFTAAMMILVMHELDETYYSQWHNFHDAFYIIINMGLYAQSEPVALRIGRSSPLLLIVYIVFMLMVQVIILNMLIAIMADSHSRVSAQSELVAQNGRAQLVLEYETLELARIKRRANTRPHRSRSRVTFDESRHSSGGVFEHIVSPFELLKEKDKQRLERVCPRWLHVLMPADSLRGGVLSGEDVDSTRELQEVQKLRKELHSMQEALAAKQIKMLEAVKSGRDEQGERQRMMQALRVELSQFKEDVMLELRAEAHSSAAVAQL